MPTQAFFETEQFPFFAQLQPQIEAILTEGREVMSRQESLSFFFPEMFTRDGLLSQGSRARFMLRLAGLRLTVNERLCPRTTAALAHIPGLVSAGFYLLGPRSVIKPHCGAGEQFLRVHLGVVVPPACALKVAGEERSWREGEFLIFDDAFEHEAWNHSDSLRCVFHFDFFYGVREGDWQARLADLEKRVVRASPALHAHWLLAGVETDPENRLLMEETLARLAAPAVAGLRGQIEGNGLFMA